MAQGNRKVDIEGDDTNPQCWLKTLPPELLHLILEFLHDDRTSLASFSLTSKSCVVFAQYHLFISGYVKVSIDPGSPFNLMDFCVLLESVPHIGGYIKELRIHSEVKSQLSMGPQSMLISIIGKLTALHILVFGGVELALSSDIWDVPEPLATVNDLVLLDICTAAGVDELSQSLTQLFKIFSVQNSLQLIEPEVGPMQHPLHIPVETLIIRGGRGCHPRFESTIIFPRLTTLATSLGEQGYRRDEDDNFIPQVNLLLRYAGSRLQHFRVDVDEAWVGDIELNDSWEIFHLGSICPSLESVQVGFFIYFQDERNTEAAEQLDFVLRVLSSAPTALSHIVLGINGPLHEDIRGRVLSPVDWHKLSRIMDGFHSLTSVKFLRQTFNYKGVSRMGNSAEQFDPAFQAFFTEQFPNLKKRDILHFR